MTTFLGGAEAVLRAFRESVKVATSVDVSAAWASPGPALDLLCAAATRGIAARIVVGRDFGGTHPAAVERLFRLFPGRLRWGRAAPGATFHTKFYLFASEAGKSLLIGSPNLTLAAFTRNAEAAVVIDDHHALADAEKWFQSVWDQAELVDQLSLDNYSAAYDSHASGDDDDTDVGEASASNVDDTEAEVLQMSGRLLSLNWQEYEADLHRIDELLSQDPYRLQTLAGPRSRLEAIEQLAPLLDVPLQNANKVQRAALFGDDETQSTYPECAWLGRMNGAGMARKLLSKEGPESRSAQKQVWEALMAIPGRGERRPTIKETQTLYERIRSISGVGGAVATRYMTIRRPDCYVSINGASLKGLSRVFSIPASRLNRWDGVSDLLELLWVAPWMNASQPGVGLGQRIWLARTALMDAFVYQSLQSTSPLLDDLLPNE